MKNIFYLTLVVLTICSCNQNTKEKELLEKENELLKKENDLITKEKQQQSSTNSTSLQSNSKADNTETTNDFYTYQSDKGFKIDCPALLHKSPSRQYDYEEFASKSGDVLLSLHTYNLSDFTLSDYYGDEYQVKGRSISYKVFKDNWYVVSGTKSAGDREYYSKSYVSSNNPKEVRVMYLEYPKSRQSEFDNIISRMIKTFKDN